MNENTDTNSIEALYGLDAETEQETPVIADVEQLTGISAHNSYLRRLDLKLTEAEAAALKRVSDAQMEALCVGDTATADQWERQASPVLALVCERLADEARELALSQPEHDAFADLAQWLTNAATFGFESNEDREEFKKLLV